jgi:hypothetical protein
MSGETRSSGRGFCSSSSSIVGWMGQAITHAQQQPRAPCSMVYMLNNFIVGGGAEPTVCNEPCAGEGA